ncbi:unnamed protein product [Pedinophyceae sp. YPF-701]|nr:unnamed protein product [Pedinophyceae sp. YPF-701]
MDLSPNAGRVQASPPRQGATVRSVDFAQRDRALQHMEEDVPELGRILMSALWDLKKLRERINGAAADAAQRAREEKEERRAKLERDPSFQELKHFSNQIQETGYRAWRDSTGTEQADAARKHLQSKDRHLLVEQDYTWHGQDEEQSQPRRGRSKGGRGAGSSGRVEKASSYAGSGYKAARQARREGGSRFAREAGTSERSQEVLRLQNKDAGYASEQSHGPHQAARSRRSRFSNSGDDRAASPGGGFLRQGAAASIEENKSNLFAETSSSAGLPASAAGSRETSHPGGAHARSSRLAPSVEPSADSLEGTIAAMEAAARGTLGEGVGRGAVREEKEREGGAGDEAGPSGVGDEREQEGGGGAVEGGTAAAAAPEARTPEGAAAPGQKPQREDRAGKKGRSSGRGREGARPVVSPGGQRRGAARRREVRKLPAPQAVVESGGALDNWDRSRPESVALPPATTPPPPQSADATGRAPRQQRTPGADSSESAHLAGAAADLLGELVRSDVSHITLSAQEVASALAAVDAAEERLRVHVGVLLGLSIDQTLEADRKLPPRLVSARTQAEASPPARRKSAAEDEASPARPQSSSGRHAQPRKGQLRPLAPRKRALKDWVFKTLGNLAIPEEAYLARNFGAAAQQSVVAAPEGGSVHVKLLPELPKFEGRSAGGAQPEEEEGSAADKAAPVRKPVKGKAFLSVTTQPGSGKEGWSEELYPARPITTPQARERAEAARKELESMVHKASMPLNIYFTRPKEPPKEIEYPVRKAAEERERRRMEKEMQELKSRGMIDEQGNVLIPGTAPGWRRGGRKHRRELGMMGDITGDQVLKAANHNYRSSLPGIAGQDERVESVTPTLPSQPSALPPGLKVQLPPSIREVAAGNRQATEGRPVVPPMRPASVPEDVWYNMTAAAAQLSDPDKPPFVIKIFQGTILEGEAFAEFYQRHRDVWNPIAVILMELEDWCSKMQVRRAYINTEILVPLALSTIVRGQAPEAADIMMCISNIHEIEEQLQLPGWRFRRPDGLEVAARYIQAAWRAFARSKELERMNRAAHTIQTKWRLRRVLARTRQIILEIQERREAAFWRIQASFKAAWSDIVREPHVVVHLPSQSIYNEELEFGVLHPESRHNAQIGRLMDVANDLSDVVYVAPHTRMEDVDAYWNKILSVCGVDSPDRRYRIVVPENLGAIPLHLSLTSTLLYSPKAMARMRLFIGSRPAYIVGGAMGKEDMDLAVAMGLPIFGPHPLRAAAMRRKSKRRRMLRLSQVNMAPGVELPTNFWNPGLSTNDDDDDPVMNPRGGDEDEPQRHQDVELSPEEKAEAEERLRVRAAAAVEEAKADGLSVYRAGMHGIRSSSIMHVRDFLTEARRLYWVFSPTEILANELSLLIAQYPRFDRWILKVDDEVRGRGFAWLDIEADRALADEVQRLRELDAPGEYAVPLDAEARALAATELARLLEAALPAKCKIADTRLFPSWRPYADAFMRRGGVIEACPESVVGSPEVNMVISPNGQVKLVATHERVFATPYQAVGTAFPQVSVPPSAAVDAAIAVGQALFRGGVIGHVSVSFIALRQGGVLRLWANDFQIGFTQSASTYSVFNLLADGEFSARTGAYFTEEQPDESDDEDTWALPNRGGQVSTGILSKRCYLSIDFLHHPVLGRMPYSELFERCRMKGIFFDMGARRGTAFTLMDSFTGCTVGLLSVAEDPFDAMRQATQVLSFVHHQAQRLGVAGPTAAGQNEQEDLDHFSRTLAAFRFLCRQLDPKNPSGKGSLQAAGITAPTHKMSPTSIAALLRDDSSSESDMELPPQEDGSLSGVHRTPSPTAQQV